MTPTPAVSLDRYPVSAKRRSPCAASPPLTDWERYVVIDPRLARLEAEARIIVARYSRRSGYCPISWWYLGSYQRPGFKRLVNHLAGFHAAAPGIQSTKAYDVVKARIYGILSERLCRHPGRHETCGFTRQEPVIRGEIEAIAAHLGIQDLYELRPSIYRYDRNRHTLVLRDPSEFAS